MEMMPIYASVGKEQNEPDKMPLHFVGNLSVLNEKRCGIITSGYSEPNMVDVVFNIIVFLLITIISVGVIYIFNMGIKNIDDNLTSEITNKPVVTVLSEMKDPQARIRVEDAIAKYIERKLR
jgi:hypothetical protein